MREYLQSIKAGRVNRKTLIDVMARALTSTSKIEDGHQLRFVLHHVVADVESMFPEFAGDVTLDSVQTGWGSNFALVCMTHQMQSSTSYSDRLKYVHEKLLEELSALAEKGVEGEMILLSMGYEPQVVGQTLQIISTFNGWNFSLTDTEHICCKCYVCICHAHPIHSGMDCPETFATHCWPIRGDDETRPWMEWVKRVFD